MDKFNFYGELHCFDDTDKKEFSKIADIVYILFKNLIEQGLANGIENTYNNTRIQNILKKDIYYAEYVSFSLKVMIKGFAPDLYNLILKAKAKELSIKKEKFSQILFLELLNYIFLQLYISKYYKVVYAIGQNPLFSSICDDIDILAIYTHNMNELIEKYGYSLH